MDTDDGDGNGDNGDHGDKGVPQTAEDRCGTGFWTD